VAYFNVFSRYSPVKVQVNHKNSQSGMLVLRLNLSLYMYRKSWLCLLLSCVVAKLGIPTSGRRLGKLMLVTEAGLRRKKEPNLQKFECFRFLSEYI
jgi:hypothetical protein